MNNFQGILTSIKIPKIYLAFLKSTLPPRLFKPSCYQSFVIFCSIYASTIQKTKLHSRDFLSSIEAYDQINTKFDILKNVK